MKKVLQKTLFRLQALLLLAVMFVVGSSAGWAQSPDAEFSITGKSNQTQSGTVNGVNWTCHLSAWAGGANFYAYDEDLFTVEAPDSKVITKIVMTLCDSSNPGGTATLDKDGGDVGELVYANGKATWTGESNYVQYTRTGDRDWSFNYVEVWLADAGADDGSVKSTLNFDSWNLSYSGGSAKPASSTHFNNGEVFSNADGVTMTLNDIPATQNWPSECFYSNPSGSTMALYLCNGEGFTIAAPSGYSLSKIVVNRAGTSYSMTSLIIDGMQNDDGTKGTWTGEAESVAFSTISGTADKRILISNIQVTLTPAEEGEITYTINFVDAPTGAYVTLDEQRFEDDGTYPVEKSLGKDDLEAYEPEGYYAEVEYTRDNHTYTVTYHAYNYYDVTVTGTSDANAGVVYGGHTYGNGDRIESKDVLNLGSVEAAELDGMESEVSFADNRYTVAYTKLAYIRFDFKTDYSFNKGGIQASSSNTYPNSTKGTNIYSNYQITVTAESPIEKIVFNGLQGYNSSDSHNVAVISGDGSWKDNNNSTSPATWVAGANCTKVVFGSNDGSDMYIASIDVYLKTVEPINYTIEFVNAPDDAYITLDGETINRVNSGYTVAKELNAESVTYAYEPAGYYADVTYDEENHKFTVTYVEGGRVEFGTEFSGQTVTTDGITYDRGWSWGELYQTSYSGYGRIYVKSETKSIKKVVIACNGSASPVIEEFGVGSMAANGNTAVWTASEDGVVQDLTFYSTSSSSLAVSKVTVYYNELPNIDYPVVIAVEGDLPADFTPIVTVDGKNFTENGTCSTPKTLTKDNVSATLPENGDWYYDVDYAEATNTFTVTYKEYLHYFVSVEGCDDETAGVRMGDDIYNDGEKINVKEALTAEALTAVTVNGYDVEAPVVGEGTVTVTYTVAGLVEYAVTITGMPEGASVKIEDDVYSENTDNGVHQSNKTLSSEVVTIQNCPETHYTNDSNEWFNEEDKAFNIAFTPYLVYTVAVDEASAYQGEEAGVKVFNANTYLPGHTIYNKTALTESDVKAADVDGFTGTVTLADNVFTVSYTKNDFIVFDASKFTQDGGYGNLDETIDGVRLQCWDSGEYFGVNNRSNSHIVLSSSEAPIVKVEIEYISWGKPSYGYATVDGKNTGELNTEDDFTTWTGSTNDLELWDSTNNTAYVSSIKVYLAQATTYYVNIEGMPAQGATVIVNMDYNYGYYTENGNYEYVTYDELSESSITAIAPQSHQVDKAYDESTKTFSVNYTALPTYEYTFVVEPYEDTNLKVYIDGEPYGDGVDYYTFYRELTLEDIITPEYEGYYANPSVKIEDYGTAYLVTVVYKPLPTLAISSSASDSEGNYWTSFCFEKPFSLPEGFTPCIVTGVENGKLTVQEFETVNNETSTMLDFNAGEVLLSEGRLISYDGNNGVDITMIGGKVGSTTLQGQSTITFSSTTPIKSIRVTPFGAAMNLAGYGYGAVCSLNGGSGIRVEDTPYIFEVNANSCTLSLTNGGSGEVYISYIEVIAGEKTIPVIPANTGVLVKSSEAASEIPYTVYAESVETVDVSENILSASGSTGFSVKNDADNLYYKLTLNAASEAGTAGFYWDKNSDEGHSINVPAHKAYLKLDAATASNFRYLIGGEEEGTLTAIDGVVETEYVANIYDLQGKRVVAPKAGVYVKNGKKFIVK